MGRVSLFGAIMAVLVWVRGPRDALSPVWCRLLSLSNLHSDEEDPTIRRFLDHQRPGSRVWEIQWKLKTSPPSHRLCVVCPLSVIYWPEFSLSDISKPAFATLQGAPGDL